MKIDPNALSVARVTLSKCEFDEWQGVRRIQSYADLSRGELLGEQMIHPVDWVKGDLSARQSLTQSAENMHRLALGSDDPTSWGRQLSLSVDYRRRNFFDWLSKLQSIEVSEVFRRGYDIGNLELHSGGRFEGFREVVEKILIALSDYESDESIDGLRAPVSKESLRSFLVLIPVLQGYGTGIHLDPGSGCVIVDFASRAGVLFSLQVSGRGHVHYSRVGKSRKVIKITGTAKFACDDDFVEFDRILGII